MGEGTGGIGSSSSNVESLAGLYFEREPQDAVVARSRQHEIHCVAATSMSTSPSASTSRGRAAKAAPSGVEYEWYQDDEAKPLKGTDLRQVLQNGTLVFTRFVQRVEGRYHCLARLRGVGAIISRPATLTLARKWFAGMLARVQGHAVLGYADGCVAIVMHLIGLAVLRMQAW